MAEVASAETTAKPARRGRKPGPKAAPKATVRKTATRRAGASKASAKAKAKPAAAVKKASEAVKEVAYAQLGLCGKVYDEVNSRVSKAREEAPKKWSALVKRGERVQRDLRNRVNYMDVPAPIENGVTKFRKAVRKLTARVNKAA